ncbi:calcium-binding protein [Streptomyces sp. NPDC092296]|uniref:calcium-binding protein n=1 Tax=Streptomyces sp. NPDC092296 TaxID=3366012 RepID=UPI003830E244
MRRRPAVILVVAGLATAAAALPSIATSASQGDTRITSVVVNDGRTVVLGVGGPVTFPVAITATDDSGIRSVGPIGVWGPKYGILKVSPATCEKLSATTSTCTGVATVDTSRHQVWNDEAGSWYVDAQVTANDGDHLRNADLGGFSLKRESRLRGYNVPTHGKAGARAEIQGWLSRAWWDNGEYHGSPDDQVRLMFRPDGGDTWTAVSTRVTNSLGQVTATVELTRSGWYQWTFAGSKWTGPARSEPRHVDVG